MASSIHLDPLEEPRSTTFQNFLDGEVPTTDDILNIQRFVADLRNTCSDLDDRATFLRAALEATEKARASVRAVIDEHIALYRPVTRLPAEVLALIFGYTFSGKLNFCPQEEVYVVDHRPDPWRILTLAAVCRQWRDVLYEAVAIWTKLDLVQAGIPVKHMRLRELRDEHNGYLATLRSALSRSKHAPLDIAIRGTWSNGLRVLQEHAHHIQRLSICYYGIGTPDPLEGLSMLRELDIVFSHYPPQSIQFGRPPQLQTLIIQCGWVDITFGPWEAATASLRLETLTRLELVSSTSITDGSHFGPHGPPWYTQCPALVYLKDQNNYVRVKTRTVPTTLEHLEYLECASAYSFKALTCPALKTLYIPSCLDLELRETIIRKFLHRSGCNINRVELELDGDFFVPTSIVLDILTNATEIRLFLQDSSAGYLELLEALDERDENVDEWKAAPRLRVVSLVFEHLDMKALLATTLPSFPVAGSFIQNRKKYDPMFNVDVEYWVTGRAMQGADKKLESSAHYQMFASAGANVQVKLCPKVDRNKNIEETDSEDYGDHEEDGPDEFSEGEDSDEDEGHSHP